MKIYQVFKRHYPEPFSIFFSIGWLMGLFFIGIWPVFGLLNLINYPGAYHSQGAISLFLGSFAIGFLLTALPRFTGTMPATGFNIFILLLLIFVEFVFLINLRLGTASFCMTLKFLYIFYFVFSRARNKTLNLPPSFIWIPLALSCVIFGGLGLFLNDYFSQYIVFFKSLIYRGFITSLFIGIGGRLVPLLTQMPVLSVHNQNYKNHIYAAITFFVGLVFETLFPSHMLRLGFALQAFALAFEIIFLWRLYHFPSGGMRAFALWVSSWLIISGPVLSFIWPQYTLHVMHLTFIGSFAAATLTVATHVVVSHNDLNKKLLKKIWPLGIIWTLIILGALTRITAHFVNYFSHLSYAAILILISLLLWGAYFLTPKWQK